MRAAEFITAAWRFLGVLDGVGNIELKSAVGGASDELAWSESESAPFPVLRDVNGDLRGVL